MDYLLELIDRNKHRIDYKKPDHTILLEISNDLLCLTVVKNYYLYRMYNLFALSKSDEELRLEKEKLMNFQYMAEERKKLNNFGKCEGLETDKNRYKDEDQENYKINDIKNNDIKNFNLPLNETDSINVLKDNDNINYNNLNNYNNDEDENSDIDLI
jgi:hypothetical protein